MPNTSKKTRSVFTASLQSPNVPPYPIPMLPNGTPLRPYPYAALPPRFPGPRFPHPQYINRAGYPMMPGLMPMFPSTNTSQPVMPTPSSSESQVHYGQPPQYMGPQFPNPVFLNRSSYPMVHGMVPMYPFPQNMSLPPHALTSHSSVGEPQFNFNPVLQPQEISFSGNISSQVQTYEEGNGIRSNLEDTTILLSEELNDSQEGIPIDTQVLQADSMSELTPTATDNTFVQGVALELEVETSNIKQELPEETMLQEGVVANDVMEEEIEQPSSSSQDYTPPASPGQHYSKSKGLKINMDTTVQDEVLRAAKALFSKRTRTLYHWLYPDKSKTKLKATVTSAWDTLPENEKHFYISQVLGKFGVQTGTLMINPQLDGIKGYTKDVVGTVNKRTAFNTIEPSVSEERKAVEDLLAVYHDPTNWDLDSHQDQRRRKRRAAAMNSDDSSRSPFSFTDEDYQDGSGKCARRAFESDIDFEGDVELNSELEKFRLFADDEALLRDDTWSRSPKATDLFTDFGI